MSPAQAARVTGAVGLYGGEFLEGCVRDWCLFERECLRDGYLLMLDKLMSYSKVRGDYRAGIDFGVLSLKEDNARETTHRCLMHLHYLAGDRTAALRQYQRCAEALLTEFDVGPARGTVELLEAIRADRVESGDWSQGRPVDFASNAADEASLLKNLTKLCQILSEVRSDVNREIALIERGLRIRD
jgi:DNA-binding SARP family transcriptional activator